MPLTFQSNLKRFIFEPWHQISLGRACYLECSRYIQINESNVKHILFQQLQHRNS